MSVRGVVPAVVVAGVAALVAGGCGSSKPAAPLIEKQKPRLTEKRFIAAADAVCVRSDRRIYKLGPLSTAPSGWAKTTTAADTSLKEMAALRPPAAQAAGFAQLLALGRRLRDSVWRVHHALVEENLRAARRAQLAAAGLGKRIHTQAGALGLTFCEQPLTNWPA